MNMGVYGDVYSRRTVPDSFIFCPNFMLRVKMCHIPDFVKMTASYSISYSLCGTNMSAWSSYDLCVQLCSNFERNSYTLYTHTMRIIHMRVCKSTLIMFALYYEHVVYYA
jgi:hypothetical protein